MATAPPDDRSAPAVPPRHDPSPGGPLQDALEWWPSSRLGRIAVRVMSLIPGPRLLRSYQVTTGTALLVANLVGLAIVLALNLWVIPGSPIPAGDATTLNIIVISSYTTIAFVIGGVVIWRHSEASWRWLRERRQPTESEQLAVLRGPLRVLAVLVVFWVCATILATALNLGFSWRLGLRVAITTMLGGLTTSAFGYLLTERMMRPVARVVLAHRDESAPQALPSTATRQLLSWALGTGSAVFGVWIVGLLYLTDANPSSARQLAVTMVVLSSITLLAGLLAEVLIARAVGDPLRELRRAIVRVTQGDLTARVTINDASELGLLQAGFNRMAAGLEEREALRDLFGRHVGDEVVDVALERGVSMGGETREVAAMFVDIVGSTTIAMERPADEVVTLVNRFFDVVVGVSKQYGGHVNKFAGDGALIVFGAPSPQPDFATRALAAARTLAHRLELEVPDAPATIGLSGGEVIAGNIGTAERFEYTVMGDPVNEAARLGSQAKGLPHRVAASGRLLEQAGEAERAHWEVRYSVVLRGRTSRTDVVALRDPGTPG